MNIHIFGDGQVEEWAEMKKLLGGKGANLAEMISADLPVPPVWTPSMCPDLSSA